MIFYKIYGLAYEGRNGFFMPLRPKHHYVSILILIAKLRKRMKDLIEPAIIFNFRVN